MDIELILPRSRIQGRVRALARRLRRDYAGRDLVVVGVLDKPERREIDVAADYVGFTVPSGFVVGYGIDYAERYRYLRDIYRLAPGGTS